jgi:hypothetical protein
MWDIWVLVVGNWRKTKSIIARSTATSALLAASILTACAGPQTGPLQEGNASRRFDGNTNIATRAEAIDIIIRAYPELSGFAARSLPPSAIETAPAPSGGWHVAFMQRGSGRLGILNARCFLVDGRGKVAAVGTLFVDPTGQIDEIDLRNCWSKRPAH